MQNSRLPESFECIFWITACSKIAQLLLWSPFSSWELQYFFTIVKAIISVFFGKGMKCEHCETAWDGMKRRVMITGWNGVDPAHEPWPATKLALVQLLFQKQDECSFMSKHFWQTSSAFGYMGAVNILCSSRIATSAKRVRCSSAGELSCFRSCVLEESVFWVSTVSSSVGRIK